MISLPGFLETLERSRLLQRAKVDAVRADIRESERNDVAVVARALVDRRLLTKFHVAALLDGRDGPFFLGRYKLLNQLGSGGMGKVYLARHLDTRQRVAIKVLPPKRAAAEGTALERFRREASVSRRLSHPNVAEVLDVGQDGPVHFMVMEYIPGQSLFDMVQRGGHLRVPDAARLFADVCDGLQHVHEMGIVHRDIKPSNIMVTPDGTAKVLDLGLARAAGEEESQLTREGTIVGTMDYIAPEQASGAAADARSDIYALGCTLYFALAERPPFAGGNLMSKIYRQRMEDPELLEKVARGVPAEFAAIVRKMMTKDPADRYASAAELAADLRRWSNPELVRKLVGAAAEAGQVFRPPSPEIDDSELHLDGESLRSLGEVEPLEAPIRQGAPLVRHRAPEPVRRRSTATEPPPPTPLKRIRATGTREAPEGPGGLFVAIAVIIGLGLVAAVIVAIVYR